MPIHQMVRDNVWVLGYTLRSRRDYEQLAHWEAARRRDYLLKPDARHVLSFDDTVWPSCGSQQDIADVFAGPLNDDLAAGSCGYLTELYTLRNDGLAPPQGCAMVAVAGPCSRDVLGYPIEIAEQGLQSIRRQLDKSWQFLGFDAVEAGLGISGLSNTLFSESDLAALRPQYADLINDFGLLPDLSSALGFATERTRQVREHAPFLPVALFVLAR